MWTVSSEISIQRHHWQPPSVHLWAYCTHLNHDVCEGVMSPLDCASLVNINRRLRDNGRQVSICSIFTVHAGQNRIKWSKCEAQNVRGVTYSSRIHQINNMLKKNRAVNSLTCTWKQSPVNVCISTHCDWLKNLATCFQTTTSKTETSN